MGIKLVFSNSGGFIGKAIAWFTWSKWSHVEFLLPDGETLYGAQANGVCKRPFSILKGKAYATCIVTGSREISGRVLSYALSQENKRYDISNI